MILFTAFLTIRQNGIHQLRTRIHSTTSRRGSRSQRTATAIKLHRRRHQDALDWREHIRLRPGMYIGSLGDGSQSDDGVYVLLKEVLDNAIDEYMMGFGKHIEVTVTDDHHCKGLRTRHTAGQNRRCQLKDEYRSEI